MQVLVTSVMNVRKKAFTLIELSIVLVIMSTLIALVLGVTRFRQIGIAKVIATEQLQLRQVITNFYNVNGYLPGDYPYAWYSFSLPSLRYSATNTIPSSTLLTQFMNGVGDGKISNVIQSVSAADGIMYWSEAYGVWAHAAAAGLFDYPYSNWCYTANSNANCSKVSFNIPASKKFIGSEIGYMFYVPTNTTTHGAILSSTNSYQITGKHIIEMSAFTTQDANGRGIDAAITPKLAQILDSKIDDGYPFTGYVFGLNGNGKSCHLGTDATYVANTYYNNSGVPECIMVYAITEFN